jgi:hypothetical protein
MPSHVSGGSGMIFYFPYKPTPIASLNELPEHIRAAVTGHILARVGDEYFSKLVFDFGQVVDFDELCSVEPEARNFKWKVPKYELIFSIAWPAQGIKSYAISLELDELGNVIKISGLPNVMLRPEKANTISLPEAHELVKRAGLQPTTVELRYNQDHDSIVYRFVQRGQRANAQTPYRAMELSVHTGQILRAYDSIIVH